MKPKKEFKARVRKMQKHIKALIDLAPTDRQREALYSIQGQMDVIQDTIEENFDDPPQSPSERPRPQGIPN